MTLKGEPMKITIEQEGNAAKAEGEKK